MIAYGVQKIRSVSGRKYDLGIKGQINFESFVCILKQTTLLCSYLTQCLHAVCRLIVVMGVTMASKFFKPEKNLEVFRLKF